MKPIYLSLSLMMILVGCITEIDENPAGGNNTVLGQTSSTNPASSMQDQSSSSEQIIVSSSSIQSSSSQYQCPEIINASTPNILETLSECENLFRQHAHQLVQIDRADKGFASISRRFWMTAGVVDSMAALDRETLLPVKTYSTNLKDYQKEHPVLSLYNDLQKNLCEAHPIDRTSMDAPADLCYQMVEATFNTRTGIPDHVYFNFITTMFLEVDGNPWIEFSSPIWEDQHTMILDL